METTLVACHNSPSRLVHIARPQRVDVNKRWKLDCYKYANPFPGLDHKDPYTHLTKFYEISRMLGGSETEEDGVFLRWFPYYVIGKKEVVFIQSTSTMMNWDVLEENFLNRFFPHNEFMEAKTTILVFSKGAFETLYEAWERHNYMLRKYGFNKLTDIHVFENGL